MQTFSNGDISGIGGKGEAAQQFAASLSAKLEQCPAATVEMTSPTTGRGR